MFVGATMSADRRKTLLLVLCCAAQFMVILDVSIVNVALPSIRADLGFSAVNLQWIVNAYTLTFAGFLLLGGRAADLIGRRPVFVAGLSLFALASLLGGLAQSQEMLIGARALQGLGGAIVAPATLSVLTTTFKEGSERNRALSFWGAMGGAGGATGALLGGVLTQGLGWEWILFVNVPIGAVAAWAAYRLVDPDRPGDARLRHFDLPGALTVTAGLVILVYAIVRTDVNGWGSASTLVVAGIGLALLALFLLIEGRFAERPLMPLSIFRVRTLSAANVVVFMLGAGAFAMWYFVSLYLQGVLGYSAIGAGVAFLPMTLAIVAGSTIAGRSVSRIGAGPMLIVGMSLIAIGMVLFARVPVDGHYLSDVLAPSLLTAAGIGLSFVPVSIAGTSGVARADAGLASGLLNTSRQVGGSLGLAILATIATQRTADLEHHGTRAGAALVSGYHHAFAVGSGFAVLGAIAAIALLPRVRRREEPASASSSARASA
jgi:EmrB/QacA subfamily drug resistance transporter